MESQVFKGIEISTTSNKIDGKFKQEVPTKTAYITVKDSETSQKMVNFGLTKYTSKEDGEDFFILKMADKLRLYFPDGTNQLRRDFSNVMIDEQATLNFKTKAIDINVVKGENMGNVFYRLQAMNIKDIDDIEQIEPENPFLRN